LGAISKRLEEEQLEPANGGLGVGEEEGWYAGSNSESKEFIIDDDNSSVFFR
jgi:hypothetical protein